MSHRIAVGAVVAAALAFGTRRRPARRSPPAPSRRRSGTALRLRRGRSRTGRRDGNRHRRRPRERQGPDRVHVQRARRRFGGCRRARLGGRRADADRSQHRHIQHRDLSRRLRLLLVPAARRPVRAPGRLPPLHRRGRALQRASDLPGRRARRAQGLLPGRLRAARVLGQLLVRLLRQLDVHVRSGHDDLRRHVRLCRHRRRRSGGNAGGAPDRRARRVPARGGLGPRRDHGCHADHGLHAQARSRDAATPRSAAALPSLHCANGAAAYPPACPAWADGRPARRCHHCGRSRRPARAPHRRLDATPTRPLASSTSGTGSRRPTSGSVEFPGEAAFAGHVAGDTIPAPAAGPGSALIANDPAQADFLQPRGSRDVVLRTERAPLHGPNPCTCTTSARSRPAAPSRSRSHSPPTGRRRTSTP